MKKYSLSKYSLSSLIFLTGIEKRGIKLLMEGKTIKGNDRKEVVENLIKRYSEFFLTAISIEFQYGEIKIRESRVIDNMKIARVQDYKKGLAKQLTSEFFQKQERGGE